MRGFKGCIGVLTLVAAGLIVHPGQTAVVEACGGGTACQATMQQGRNSYNITTLSTTVTLSASATATTWTNPGIIRNTAYARDGWWTISATRQRGTAFTIGKVTAGGYLDVDARNWSLSDASVSVPKGLSVTLNTSTQQMKCYSPQAVAASQTSWTGQRSFSLVAQPGVVFCQVTIGGLASLDFPTFTRIVVGAAGNVELKISSSSSAGYDVASQNTRSLN